MGTQCLGARPNVTFMQTCRIAPDQIQVQIQIQIKTETRQHGCIQSAAWAVGIGLWGETMSFERFNLQIHAVG